MPTRKNVCRLQYIHTYTHTHIHTYTRTHVHTYTRTHVHTYIHTYIETYTHIHTHTHTYTYIHTYRHTDIQTYRHTDIQTYRHTNIQTYRHTDIHTHRHTLDKNGSLYDPAGTESWNMQIRYETTKLTMHPTNNRSSPEWFPCPRSSSKIICRRRSFDKIIQIHRRHGFGEIFPKNQKYCRRHGSAKILKKVLMQLN